MGFSVQFEHTLILFPSEGQNQGENLNLTGNGVLLDGSFETWSWAINLLKIKRKRVVGLKVLGIY
jgi:hypothetical protein